MTRLGLRWGDLGIGIAIAFLAAVGFLALTPRSAAPGTVVQVTVRGELAAELDLGIDSEFDVAVAGGTARVEILKGRVRVVDTDVCPLKICVHTGWIDRPGQTIVCLPNRLLVRIVSTER